MVAMIDRGGQRNSICTVGRTYRVRKYRGSTVQLQHLAPFRGSQRMMVLGLVQTTPTPSLASIQVHLGAGKENYVREGNGTDRAFD